MGWETTTSKFIITITFLHRNSGAEINRYFYKSGSSEPILLTEKMNKRVDIRDKNKLRS